MTRVTDIPPEILLQILEHTRPDAHRSLPWTTPPMRSFPAYALVCRAWAATAQRALFRIAQPSTTSTVFLDILKELQRRGSTLPNAVDKLTIELGLGWSLGALAQTIALCRNLRHIELRYMSELMSVPRRGFTDGDLATLSRTRSVTHLTAVILLEKCDIIPQLVGVWPGLRYLELRSGFPLRSAALRDGALENLRELRLHAPCEPPALHLPRLEALTIDGNNASLAMLVPETLARVQSLHLQTGSYPSIHPTLSHLHMMEGLKTLTLSSYGINSAIMDAIPAHIKELGMQLRLVLHHTEDIAGLVRCQRLKCLRSIIIYIVDELDSYEEGRVKPVSDACSSSNVQLCLRNHADLWDVPISYN